MPPISARLCIHRDQLLSLHGQLTGLLAEHAAELDHFGSDEVADEVADAVEATHEAIGRLYTLVSEETLHAS